MPPEGALSSTTSSPAGIAPPTDTASPDDFAPPLMALPERLRVWANAATINYRDGKTISDRAHAHAH